MCSGSHMWIVFLFIQYKTDTPASKKKKKKTFRIFLSSLFTQTLIYRKIRFDIQTLTCVYKIPK